MYIYFKNQRFLPFSWQCIFPWINLILKTASKYPNKFIYTLLIWAITVNITDQIPTYHFFFIKVNCMLATEFLKLYHTFWHYFRTRRHCGFPSFLSTSLQPKLSYILFQCNKTDIVMYHTIYIHIFYDLSTLQWFSFTQNWLSTYPLLPSF